MEKQKRRFLSSIFAVLILTPAVTSPVLYRVTDLLVPLSRYAKVSRMLPVTVVRVVDGDTIEVEIDDPPPGLEQREIVRLIGVDTPETVDPHKPVQAFGREASAFTKERLLGKTVYLAFDQSLRDVYQRLLAYVYLGNGTCFDLELVAEGYGFAYVKYPFFFMDEFRNAELSARYANKGLWGRK